MGTDGTREFPPNICFARGSIPNRRFLTYFFTFVFESYKYTHRHDIIVIIGTHALVACWQAHRCDINKR